MRVVDGRSVGKFGDKMIKDVIREDLGEGEMGLVREYGEVIGMIKGEMEEWGEWNVV